MCVVCGCADPNTARVEGQGHHHEHEHAHAHDHPHHGEGPQVDAATGDLHYGAGAARVSVPGLSQQRAIVLEANVLGENERVAQHNRAHFRAHGVLALNLVSSPGSGKTTLLVETIRRLRQQHPDVPLAVIEGDQQTSNDAERIRATGAPAIQVNTGKGCHLDAPMVQEAFDRLPLHDTGGLLMIENVGNLVCPAMWDLGEAAKVAILSVTEGEDKPLKYPDMFAAARLMLLNKVDLLPHLDFDVKAAVENARRVNPRIEVIEVSARSGAGLNRWIGWLLHEWDHLRGHAHHHHHDDGHAHGADEVALLKKRIAELEAQLNALMIRVSREVVTVADSSKFLKRSLSVIGAIGDVHRVITDDNAPPALVENLRSRGIDVMVV